MYKEAQISASKGNKNAISKYQKNIIEIYLEYLKENYKDIIDFSNLNLNTEEVKKDIKNRKNSENKILLCGIKQEVNPQNDFEYIISIFALLNDNIFINGEKDQIKKLISILMDNAIKYTNKNGKIMVSLNIEKNKARLEVKNTGEGIEKEHLEKIFERFYRVDNSRDRGTGGYGLGLSIAKAIVEEHKGKIYAESVVGEYTSFIVELPVYFEKQKLINDLKIGN